VVQTAIRLKQNLKRKRMTIEAADLFIAATAIAYGLEFDTLNRKHFLHIDGLKLQPE
jgi:predicted nucleic acid-binding protein